jgi:hypothetical protein
MERCRLKARELHAIAEVLDRPMWLAIAHAVRAYVGSGPGLTAYQRRQAQARVRPSKTWI